MSHGLNPTPAGTAILLRIDRAMAHLTTGIDLIPPARRREPRRLSHLTSVQIRALLALTEAGSFSGAARLLQLSEPAVHRAVWEPEQICDAVLTNGHALRRSNYVR